MEYKIIYLCYLPLVAKREHDFYMDAPSSPGAAVEYWDLSNIFFPDVHFTMEVHRPYVRKINTYKALEAMLVAQDRLRSVFVVIISFNGMSLKLHRMLTRCNCYLIFFARAGLPVFTSRGSLGKRIVQHYRQFLSWNKVKFKILSEIANICRTFGLIKPYDLVFAAGSAEASQYGTSNVVAINHFDFDRYLLGQSETRRTVTNEYAVFLDDNLAFDSDFKVTGTGSIEPAAYFRALRGFFDAIEATHKLKVVIAAHPKSEYRGDEFGDRTIIKDATNELVKACRFALAHYSTSVSFAVLHRKPLAFIYTHDMERFDFFSLIKGLASALNAPLLEIGRSRVRDEHLPSFAAPDLKRYDEYKYRYLTSPTSEHQESRAIFIHTLRGLRIR